MARMAIIVWIAISTIVIGTNTADVPPTDKLQADISNIKDQLSGMPGKTEELVQSLDAFSQGLDGYIKEDDKADVLKNKISTAKDVLVGTLNAIPKFKSGDPADILCGVLDMTTMALETFGGPFGAAAAEVLNIVSSLIGLFMTTPKTEPSLEHVMRDVLEEFHEDKLKKSMNSFVVTLSTVHHGILAARKVSKDTEGRDLSSDDVTRFESKIKAFEAQILMEDVKQHLGNALESGNVKDAKRALKTFEIYCKLTTCVELIMVEFIDYIKHEGKELDTKLPAYYHGILSKKRESDKDFFEFLHYPDMDNALAAAIYQDSPEKYPIMRKYIEAIKVNPIPNLGWKDGKEIQLTTKKWPDWHFYLSSEGHAAILGSQKTNDQNKFILKKANSGREWMLENKYYRDYYMAARKWDGCLPLVNHDEIHNVEGLKLDYMANIKHDCPQKCVDKCHGCYYNCFSTFKAGKLRDIVSFNYKWRFTKVKSNGGCSYYMISATQEQFGPAYTLFMRDSKNGNAYLKYGNTKEPGMFRIC